MSTTLRLGTVVLGGVFLFALGSPTASCFARGGAMRGPAAGFRHGGHGGPGVPRLGLGGAVGGHRHSERRFARRRHRREDFFPYGYGDPFYDEDYGYAEAAEEPPPRRRPAPRSGYCDVS